MLSESLRLVMIEHLLEKREIMRKNGSNCADIDAQLLHFGYKQELNEISTFKESK